MKHMVSQIGVYKETTGHNRQCYRNYHCHISSLWIEVINIFKVLVILTCLRDKKNSFHVFSGHLKKSPKGENKLLTLIYLGSEQAQAYKTVAFNSQTRNFFRVNFSFSSVWIENILEEKLVNIQSDTWITAPSGRVFKLCSLVSPSVQAEWILLYRLNIHEKDSQTKNENLEIYWIPNLSLGRF